MLNLKRTVRFTSLKEVKKDTKMKPAPTWKELNTRQQRKYAIKMQNNSAIKLSMAEALKRAEKVYDGDDQ